MKEGKWQSLTGSQFSKTAGAGQKLIAAAYTEVLKSEWL